LSDGYAQPNRLQFVHLTPDDGLSSSIITAITQDQKGFIWIGTNDGLNRYDGFNFVAYENNPHDSASLPDNYIQTMLEDHDMNLLIGTEDGLCLYDRKRDCFRNYMLDKSSPLRGINCTVTKILEDSLSNLWLSTSVGLIYFDRTKNQIIRFSHDPNNPESLSNNNIEAVFIDKDNRFWVATRTGLNLFHPETGTFKHINNIGRGFEDLSTKTFWNITEDWEGDIWFGSTDGLYCLKKTLKGEITNLIHYQHNARDNFSLSLNQVISLFVDNKGNLWIGTENGGINLFDREHQRFWHYRKDDYDPLSLSNESIQTIYQDKTGNLWFGTYTGGLNIAMKNRDGIVSYQAFPGAPYSLSHNTVSGFLEGHSGQIWVSTDGGGLYLLDNQNNSFQHFNTDNSHLSSNAVLCMVEDSNNQIWLGTWAGGLIHLESKTKSMTSFNTRNSSIQDDNIFDILKGDDNDLWLGSFGHGLIHYQIKENLFTDYTPDNSGLSNENVVKLVRLSRHRLLIGTSENFQIYSLTDGQFITYKSDQKNENSLSYPKVTDMLVENDSCIWIGTPHGLNRFNPVTGTFRRYYEEDGLPNNFIKGLILDNSGILWVTTNKGICRFDYRNLRFKNFTKADGLQSNEFSERSILKTKTGVLLMGGTKGFNIVYPEKIAENKSIPAVLITDLKIFNKSVKPGDKSSPLTQNITETKSLILSHKQSVLTFSFAVMDFSAPEKNKYAYKMENFDKDWIYTDNRYEVTYTNLNPGNYVFRVKGSNNSGLWNETGTSLRITILPPWWATWWFRVIVVSAIILIFVIILISRVRQLKNQKALLEKLVVIKTAELQEKNTTLEERQLQIEKQSEELLSQKEALEKMYYELQELNASKDKFFSIIAHDLKNPFSTIIGFSDMLNDEFHTENPENAKEYAKLINTSAVQTLKLLENLLEWANSQRGKISFKPLTINLGDIMNEEFLNLNDAAHDKNIELKSTVPEKLTVFADRNMIKTILRNLISNAIKFTHRKGKVEIKAFIDNDFVEIEVSDNGIGISKETMSKLFRIDADLSTRGTENEKGTGLGLFLCKEFVEKHGGKIWVESESGRGSTFKLVLPSGSAPLA